jgi:undecaprenyl-diphosphatase
MDPIATVAAIQIITESLPISSSSHVMLAKEFVPFLNTAWQTMPNHLDHFLHGPTVIIVSIFFSKEWFNIIKTLFCKPYQKSKRIIPIIIKTSGFVTISAIITGLWYTIINIVLQKSVMLSSTLPTIIGLAATTIMLFSLKLKDKLDYRIKQKNSTTQNRHSSLDLKKTIIISLIQGIALLPGISRLASTYAAARWLNLSPRRSLQTSFLFAYPLFTAAFLINGLPEIIKGNNWKLISSNQMILTFGVSSVAAYFMLAFTHKAAKTHKFWMFGIYTFVPTAIFIYKALSR